MLHKHTDLSNGDEVKYLVTWLYILKKEDIPCLYKRQVFYTTNENEPHETVIFVLKISHVLIFKFSGSRTLNQMVVKMVKTILLLFFYQLLTAEKHNEMI